MVGGVAGAAAAGAPASCLQLNTLRMRRDEIPAPACCGKYVSSKDENRRFLPSLEIEITSWSESTRSRAGNLNTLPLGYVTHEHKNRSRK